MDKIVSNLIFANDEILLQCEITFANAMVVHEKAMALLTHQEVWRINFRNLLQANTALLIVLLEWIRCAQLRKKKLLLLNLPEQCITIAKLAKIDGLINSYVT